VGSEWLAQNELYSPIPPPPVRPDEAGPNAALRNSMAQTITANAEPIPGYRLIERLGRGGYGEVWKAEAPGGMHKAIKFVFGDMEGAGDDGKAAEQEFRSLHRVKTIRHPFILSLERFEVIDGQLVIVMELADRNLWDRFTECVTAGHAGIPRTELLSYLDEAAEALDLMNLHHQIQHLDVKPQNLFLVHRHVKVADFGLAKDMEGARANLTGGLTPVYASPETFDGWLSQYSDQYSLAIVYQEMLTGRRPFNGTSARQLVLQHMAGTPDLAPLPSEDRAAVARALAKKPDERFTSCTNFVRALRGETPSSGSGSSSSRAPIARVQKSTDSTAKSTSRSPSGSQRVGAGLPALRTQGSRLTTPLSRTTPRSPGAEPAPDDAPKAGPVDKAGDGVLFPALLIGVGGTGRTVLRALRQIFLDRFGRASLPHLRWLYVDTDPAGIVAARAGPAATALTNDEMLLMQIRRPSHYLNRDVLPPTESWLSQEELFRISRNGTTEGVRAIGRLALCDHYHVLRHRLRVGLETLLKPERIAEADRITQLGVRSTMPRVYLATSLVGGTGSGMFVDMAYLVRREARELRVENLPVIGLLGTPEFSSKEPALLPLLNSKAALTEVHHFSRSKVTYQARFDTREAAVTDANGPFARSCLIPFPAIADGEGFACSIDFAAHIAFVDLVTKAGRAIHPDANVPAAGAVSMVGIARLAWPRARVLGAGAWLLARRALRAWTQQLDPKESTAPRKAVDAFWDEHQLGFEPVRAIFEAHLRSPAINAYAKVDSILAETERGGSSRAGLKTLIELLGGIGRDGADDPAKFPQLLAVKAGEVKGQLESRLQAAILGMVEQPGLHVSAMESAIAHLRSRLEDDCKSVAQMASETEQWAVAALAPIAAEVVGNPNGNDTGVLQLRPWCQKQLESILLRACANVYRALVGNMPDYDREAILTRKRLAEFEKQLDELMPSPVVAEGVTRTVFPNGADSVAEAAARLFRETSSEDFREFENALLGQIRHQFRSFSHICSHHSDCGKAFLDLLIEQASRFLEGRVPIVPASQAIAMSASDSDDLEQRAAELVAAAAPPTFGPGRKGVASISVLGVPAGKSAGRFEAFIKERCSGAAFLTTTTSDDILLVREARNVSLTSLPHLSAELPVPTTPAEHPLGTGHSRTDIAWTPVGVD
jgi:eukaryotic-like serine/threonine-protein kinase